MLVITFQKLTAKETKYIFRYQIDAFYTTSWLKLRNDDLKTGRKRLLCLQVLPYDIDTSIFIIQM